MGEPAPAYLVRRMTLEDLPQVLQVERLSFPRPWTYQGFASELSRPRFAHYVVCLHSGRVVAQAGMQHAMDEGHITTLAVHPEWRGRHLGEAVLVALLLKSLQLALERLTLEYRRSNTAAAGLYAKYGFEVVGVRRGYYVDNHEDALVAVLEELQSARRKRFIVDSAAHLEAELNLVFRN